MSALPPKADINDYGAQCPLLTHSGHWWGSGPLTLKRACLTLNLSHCEASHSGVRGISFGYIVVSAGSAGCVLANRLTEDPDCKALNHLSGAGQVALD